MQKLNVFRFFSFLLVLMILCPIIAFQKEPLRIIGAPWAPGFFETASDIAFNQEWIYISDKNNSKIQVYSKDLSPLFHFGGYGHEPGNFIEIRGLCANQDMLYIASIDSFSQKEGRIQSFTSKGIFRNQFQKPSQRSDFLRVAALDQETIAGITEQTLCLFNQDGQLVREVSSIANHSFLFLQDIVAVPGKGFAFLDRAKRGFFLVDADFGNLRHYGEEHISIPIAIDFNSNQFIIADANGDLLFFNQNGRYQRTLATGIFSSGIQFTDPQRLLIASALRKGIAQVDLSTGQIQEAYFEPSSAHELHWPEHITINAKGHLYVNDDYLGGMKVFSLSDHSFVSKSAWIDNDQNSLKVISTATSPEKNEVYVLSRTDLSKIYVFNEDQLVQTIAHQGNDQYCQIQCDAKGNLYAFECSKKVFRRFDPRGNYVDSLELPPSNASLRAFNVKDELMVLMSNGELLVFAHDFSSKPSNIVLEPHEGTSFHRAFAMVSWNEHILISFREHHFISIYHAGTGKRLDTYGNMGGPNTYPSRENLQVDIGFQSGQFLFPSGLSLYNERLLVADSGNHRIQSIPLSSIVPVIIQLKIGDPTAYINGVPRLLDAAPFIAQSRTMVPIRFISEAFGAEVQWDNAERKITIQLEKNQIILWIQQQNALINEQEYTLDAPPIIVNQRTFVPVRFISEGFGAEVSWEPEHQIVTIRRER